MNENIGLEWKTQDIAETIAKKNQSLISLGVSELMKAMGISSKKDNKKNKSKNDFQISESQELYEKKRNKKRPPIIID